MAYAEVGDVLARAGKFSASWTGDSTPSFDDIGGFLASRAAEIDAALAGRGISVPVTAGTTAAEALRNLNAAGALVLLLTASALGAAAEAVSELLRRVEREWQEGMAAIQSGKHSAVLALEASDPTATANDFWSAEAEYGSEDWVDPNDNPFLAPEFEKGQEW